MLVILGGLLSGTGAIVVLFPALTTKPTDTESWRIDILFVSEFWRKAFIKQRRYAAVGILLIMIGTMVQALGSI